MLPVRISEFVTRRFSFRRIAGLYRRRLSRQIFALCGGVIQHGPFQGMRWLDNPQWGRSEQGVMMLGLYEQEVLQHLTTAPAKYRVFVDVGAADGYYAVGLPFCKLVDRSIAFEMIPACRDAIANLARANGVSEKVRILGTATNNLASSLAEVGVVPDETMFLIDIEGAEFPLLTTELFDFLRDSMIIVETHAHIYNDPESEIAGLIARASKTHRVSSWFPGARNPWLLRELDRFTELDRWILCSEGRVELQQWLRFDPL